MSNNKERRFPDYLKFPFDRFIMIRIEFLILTQNELEAKIMRIIEWAIESKREEIYRKGENIPEEVWVTISQSLFMDWLYGTVQSETTLKDAINSLIKKYLIFRRPSGPGRYDPLEYTLNKPLISKLFELFPKDLKEIEMASIMKQPRKSKDSEGQKLTPSKIDPLITCIRETIIDPLNHQLLTPLPGPKIDPLTELGGGQKLTPKKKEKESGRERMKESSSFSPPLTLSLSSLSDEELLAELHRRELERLSTSNVNNTDTTVEKQPETPSHIVIETTTSQEPAANNNDLDLEQLRIAGYLEESEFDFDLTDLNKQHLTKLAKKVKSLEQMKSLIDFTQNQEHLKGKTIFLGNLANTNNLNGWKQSEKAKQRRTEAQKSTPTDPSKLTSISGLRNYSAEPEVQPDIQKPPEGSNLIQVPKFSLKGLRQQMKKEGKLV